MSFVRIFDNIVGKMKTYPRLTNVSKIIAQAFLAQEGLNAAKYYRFLYGQENKGSLVQIKHLTVRVVDSPDGEYIQAPLWVEERGIISSSADKEFSTLHELGHALQPTRLIDTIAVMPLVTQMRTIPALGLSMAILFTLRSFQERHADIVALRCCSKEGLTKAWTEFYMSALTRQIHIPPDTHSSDSQRAFALQSRILQLDRNPDIACPRDLPLNPGLLLSSLGPISVQAYIKLEFDNSVHRITSRL